MRQLYLWFALAFAIMLFAFWPTTLGRFGPPDGLRILHTVFAVAWMTLLVAQGWLIGRDHNRAHRWLGRTSLVLAPALVISAAVVVLDMLPEGGPGRFPPPLRLILAWIDLWSLVLFSGLVVAALLNRRRMFFHSRLMASTVFVALIPALGRAYGMNIEALGGLTGALNPSFWTCEAVLAVLILRDGLKGRWLTPWWITLAALEAIRLTMFAAPEMGWFVALCRGLGLPG